MKCPKCGYLGFETTDRCRNCQYDFSLAATVGEPDLALNTGARHAESFLDFELPPIKRQTDSLTPAALDLDRLFGEADSSTGPSSPEGFTDSSTDKGLEESQPAVSSIEDDPVMSLDAIELEETPLPEPTRPASREPVSTRSAEPAMEPLEPVEPLGDALPFDDIPIVPPPAARAPLAVRRATAEVPRNRPRTTRPVRVPELALEPEHVERSASPRASAEETVASLMETPALAARVGAGVIDLALLAAIDLGVVYLTLRVSGLRSTWDDLAVLPVIPLVGFLALMAFGYVAAFTVAGGQTIGKMVMGLRVIGDDGRAIDTAGGMLRALGCMLVPITLGLSYVPALVTSDHRALHDRLAGTRVVRE